MRFVLETLEARGKLELYAALAPVPEFGDDVFGYESDVRSVANELEGLGARLGSDEGEIGGAVGRGDSDPAPPRLDASVENEMEAELVDVEGEAAFQIADIHGEGLQAQIGFPAVEANRGVVCPLGRRTGHEGHYYMTERILKFVKSHGDGQEEERLLSSA